MQSRKFRRISNKLFKKKDKLDKKLEKARKRTTKKHLSSSVKLNIVIGLWILDKTIMLFLFAFKEEIVGVKDLIHNLIINLF